MGKFCKFSSSIALVDFITGIYFPRYTYSVHPVNTNRCHQYFSGGRGGRSSVAIADDDQLGETQVWSIPVGLPYLQVVCSVVAQYLALVV